jgi:chorismate mutase-like protein
VSLRIWHFRESKRKDEPRHAPVLLQIRLYVPLLLYGAAGGRNARGETKELKPHKVSKNRPRTSTEERGLFFAFTNRHQKRGGDMKIDDWRRKIDAIDTAMLHLLNLRTELALEVGRLKGQAGLVLRVPEREREILNRMKGLNPGPLDGKAIGKIYQVILDESIRTQVRNGYGVPAQPKGRGRRSSKRRKLAAV